MKYGWEFSNGLLVPIITDNLLTPLGLVEISSCGCKKECFSSRCKCFKNNFVSKDLINEKKIIYVETDDKE